MIVRPQTESRWRPNPGGVLRTRTDVEQIAARHGIVPDDFLRFRVGSPPNFPNGEFARYGPAVETSRKVVEWREFLTQGDPELVLVRLNPSILDRDDAILAVLLHENFEIGLLAEEFAKIGGRMSTTRFVELVNEKTGTLHLPAWDHADEYIEALQHRGGWP